MSVYLLVIFPLRMSGANCAEIFVLLGQRRGFCMTPRLLGSLHNLNALPPND